MTKGEFLSLIKHKKSGGYPDRVSKFDDRIIAKFIDLALQQSIEEYLKTDNLNDSLLKVFYPFLKWDKDRGIAYCKLPASLLPLKNSKGLHWVSGQYDELTQWIKQENGAQEVFAELEAGNVDTQTYYLEGQNLLFAKILKSQCGIPIKVKIVCGIDGYSKDEEVKIPSTPLRFIDMVSRLMDEIKLTPQHTGNTGNPNTA